MLTKYLLSLDVFFCLTQQQYLYKELFEHDTDIFDTGKIPDEIRHGSKEQQTQVSARVWVTSVHHHALTQADISEGMTRSTTGGSVLHVTWDVTSHIAYTVSALAGWG